MSRRTQKRGAAFIVALMSLAVIAAACTPPVPPVVKNWEFKSTQVTVNEANDCLEPIIFGYCVIGSSFEDEAYVLNVGFRVKLGVPGSASAWVAGSRSNDTAVTEGQTKALSGAKQNAVLFPAVPTIDLGNLNTDDLEIVGTYTWAMEKDLTGVSGAASDVAGILEEALNNTLAADGSTLDPDTIGDVILDLIFDNLWDAFTLLMANLDFGLGDDAMGGGLYVGIGAYGGLASVIDAAAAGFSLPTWGGIPLLNLPPAIQQGGLFTMDSNRSFNGQVFDNGGCLLPQCGIHTYNFSANEV